MQAVITLLLLLPIVLIIRWFVIRSWREGVDAKIQELQSRQISRNSVAQAINELKTRIEKLETRNRQLQTEAKKGDVDGIKDSDVVAEISLPGEHALPGTVFTEQHETKAHTANQVPSEIKAEISLQSAKLPPEVIHVEATTMAASIGKPTKVVVPSKPVDEQESPPQRVKAKEPSTLAKMGREIRGEFAREEWESVVGASWLNKVGMLLLVVGIALFLGYSFANLSPPARVALGFAISLIVLVGGIFLERRAQFRLFAQGLIGGGWAAVYVTTYAMHALEAARIVNDPLIAMFLLISVAAGMILHSLRYRSEKVTGLAYVIGFITLGISPVTSFFQVASIPLVLTLLIVAHRFAWQKMALGGVLFTYGFYNFHASSWLIIDIFTTQFYAAQLTLISYWLLFESFDLLSLRTEGRHSRFAQGIFPLNACGFIGVALLQWPTTAPITLHWCLVAMAGMYFASTLVRVKLRPPASFPADTPTFQRSLLGGYEAGITLTALLALAAIGQGFFGLKLALAILIEGEFLFLAGWSLRQQYLRILAGPIFFLAMLSLLSLIAQQVQGADMVGWVPLAALMTSVFYLNRGLLRSNRVSQRLAAEKAYSYVASAIVVLILMFEVSVEYLGIAWLLFAVVLFVLSRHFRLDELRYQSYGVAVLAWLTLAGGNVLGGFSYSIHPGLPLGIASALTWIIAVHLIRLSPLQLPHGEHRPVQIVSSCAGTALVATLLWYVLPSPVIAVGWGIIGLLLIECGLWKPLPFLRIQGHILVVLAVGRLFIANFTNFGLTADISHRILTVVPLIALCWYLWLKLTADNRHIRWIKWETNLPKLYVYAAPILATVLIRFELGRVPAVFGWTLLALGLLYLGGRWNNRDLRWQSYLLAILVFARSWTTNFYIPESLAGAFGRVATGAIVVAGLYAAQFMSSRNEQETSGVTGNRLQNALIKFDANARSFFSIMATVLLTVLLFYEVSGGLLTVAWGLEGVVLLTIGFTFRERILRLSGLALLLGCILKLFTYDFLELDTIYRITSFVSLGVLLLGVSWIYTRYREQISRFL